MRPRLKAGDPTDAPDDLSLEIFAPKNLIEQYLEVVSGSMIHVKIEAAVVGQELVHQCQARVHRVKITGNAPLPPVAVRYGLSDCARRYSLAASDLTADPSPPDEVSPSGEWRIRVQQLETTGQFGPEGGHNLEVIGFVKAVGWHERG
jgi:hypothetical protein